jgi:hypothetical protein
MYTEILTGLKRTINKNVKTKYQSNFAAPSL